MTNDTDSLDGRVAVVTGAARGIGLAIARELGQAGARAVLVDVDEAENQKAAAELRAEGLDAHARRADLGASADVDALLASVATDLAVPHIVVNNAAVTRPAMLYKMTDEQWSEVLAVNLNGPFFMTRAAARLMIPERRGAIINISALAALRGALGQCNYVSAKAALVGLTKASARELARHQIRVNAVTPGVVHTRMSETLLTDERFKEQYIKEIPLGRVADPPDIARVVRFLASDASGYMTGQVLNVSGGTYM